VYSARDDIRQKVLERLFCSAHLFFLLKLWKVYFQPEKDFPARVTVVADGLRSEHACVMKWVFCDATLDAMIGHCPKHSLRGAGSADCDQICGAFVVSDPLSVQPMIGFDFAFGSINDGKQEKKEKHIRINIDVSKEHTLIYEGFAVIPDHSTVGILDEILCNRGLCLRSSNSKRWQ
jgi:hypothetical protein